MSDNFAVKVVAAFCKILLCPVAEIVRHVAQILAINNITHARLNLDVKRSDRKVKADALHNKIYVCGPLGLCVLSAKKILVKVIANRARFVVVVFLATLVVVVRHNDVEHTADGRPVKFLRDVVCSKCKLRRFLVSKCIALVVFRVNSHVARNGVVELFNRKIFVYVVEK